MEEEDTQPKSPDMFAEEPKGCVGSYIILV